MADKNKITPYLSGLTCSNIIWNEYPKERAGRGGGGGARRISCDISDCKYRLNVNFWASASPLQEGLNSL